MSWLFGKKKKQKAPEPKRDVNKVKETLDKQIDYTSMNINKYEKQIDDIKTQAKDALKRKDKKKAIMLMKKKKMFEAEISKLDGMRLMMEQQKLNMESQMNNKNVFDTMAEGTKTIQELQKEADIDKFDEIRDIHEEMEDKNREINDFFSNYAEEQTEDCEDDLAELEAELAEDEMGDDVYDAPITGGKSKNKTEKVNKEEEDMLAELMN